MEERRCELRLKCCAGAAQADSIPEKRNCECRGSKKGTGLANVVEECIYLNAQSCAGECGDG